MDQNYWYRGDIREGKKNPLAREVEQASGLQKGWNINSILEIATTPNLFPKTAFWSTKFHFS